MRSKDDLKAAAVFTEAQRIFRELGGASESRRLHGDALRVARGTRRPTLQAAMLLSAGGAAEILHDRRAALNHYAAALKLWEQAWHRRGQASAHFGIATVQEALGNTLGALEHYERAAGFWHEAGVVDQESTARGRIEAIKKRSQLVG